MIRLGEGLWEDEASNVFAETVLKPVRRTRVSAPDLPSPASRGKSRLAVVALLTDSAQWRRDASWGSF